MEMLRPPSPRRALLPLPLHPPGTPRLPPFRHPPPSRTPKRAPPAPKGKYPPLHPQGLAGFQSPGQVGQAPTPDQPHRKRHSCPHPHPPRPLLSSPPRRPCPPLRPPPPPSNKTTKSPSAPPIRMHRPPPAAPLPPPARLPLPPPPQGEAPRAPPRSAACPRRALLVAPAPPWHPSGLRHWA
eukprot:scaffold10615_cov106-Isochrysis_galbana.AAC.3